MLFRGAKAAFLSCVMAGAFFIPAGRAQTLPAEECTPEPVIAPIAATHVIPPYPQISVFANEEGVSVLKVIIDEQGDVADDTVYQSSGSVYLDNAALTFVKAKWKWKPKASSRAVSPIPFPISSTTSACCPAASSTTSNRSTMDAS